MHKELDIDNREKSSLKKSFLPRPIQNHKVSLSPLFLDDWNF